ncbi:MAG: ATP-dependent metallopeptidase FtsH/Yme1/Tma family protein, partial [Luteibacter jiangsuensis]
MNEMAKNLLLWLIIAVVLLTVFQTFNPHSGASQDMSYTTFAQQVDNGNVASGTITSTAPPTITGKLKDGGSYRTVVPVVGLSTSDLVKTMRDKGVELRQEPADNGFSLIGLLFNWLPIIIFVAVLIWFMRQMQAGSGGRGAMSFGRSRAKLQGEDQVKVNFNDVAGCDEAKEEVGELVEFLRDPGKFQKLGGKIPRGVLMVGPPGTGKTL